MWNESCGGFTQKKLEMPGIEPGAFHMQSERSTTELHPQQYFSNCKTNICRIHDTWMIIIRFPNEWYQMDKSCAVFTIACRNFPISTNITIRYVGMSA